MCNLHCDVDPGRSEYHINEGKARTQSHTKKLCARNPLLGEVAGVNLNSVQ